MAMVNAYSGKATAVSAEDRAMIARRERALGPAYRLFYEDPVHFVRGSGVWLYDPHGNAYLDAYNNVASVGHCHPHVVEALCRQAGILNTHTRYLNEIVVAYAERLLAKFPAGLDHIMFACTGSEANDLAIRLAKAATGRTGFIVTDLAYHGGTDAVAQMSPSLGKAVALGPHVRTVPAPDSFHIPAADMARRFADGVRAAIADLRKHGIEPAALLVDTIFSSDGVFSAPAGFLAEAVDVAREAGALFIADEVQAGFGRTGDRFWGFERHGVNPDMVTLGKPMGNGHPVSGVVARSAIVKPFANASRYFNTFGGNPVSCAVGMAVLDVLENENIQDLARQTGVYFRERLNALAQAHPVLTDIRGAGLFIGVEVVSGDPAVTSGDVAVKIVNEMRNRRVLLSATGPRGNVLKIRPPLTFSTDNVDFFMERLAQILTAIQR